MDFERIRTVFERLPEPDADAAQAAQARNDQLTKPPGSLGRLEEIAVWAASWQGRARPAADPIRVLVFAGNHGVTAQGVSAYPPEVTVQMVANFDAGGAAINQLCRTAGAELAVHALDLDRPTADFTRAAAMSEAECATHFSFGMDCVQSNTALLAIGEMGIGNTTSAAALAHALHGGAAEDWVGRGTGVDDRGLARKAQAVAAGLERHRAALGDPLELLRRLGGREIAAMAGAILGARLKRVPVLLDGYVATAAAAVLAAARPGALDHCLAAHRSAEAAHRRLLDALGLRPLLDLEMRLGEASGAALAALLFRAAVETHNGMATFAEAGVATAED